VFFLSFCSYLIKYFTCLYSVVQFSVSAFQLFLVIAFLTLFINFQQFVCQIIPLVTVTVTVITHAHQYKYIIVIYHTAQLAYNSNSSNNDILVMILTSSKTTIYHLLPLSSSQQALGQAVSHGEAWKY
jgi:hypothetical protein